MTGMTAAARAAQILVVRAVEETRPDEVPPAALVDSFTIAGDLDDEVGWLWRRATFLLEQPPLARYRRLAAMATAVDGGTGLCVTIPFVVGLLSNYLGPSARIHALFNPIVLLILWNLAVYGLLAGVSIGRRRSASRVTAGGETAPVVEPSPAPATPSTPVVKPLPPVPAARPGPVARWVLGHAVPALWLRVHRATGDAHASAAGFTAVGRSFWSHWMRFAQPALEPNARRALHWMAFGLAAGAVVGMYVRGLFFDYNIVWRSTFIRDPGVVAAVLNVLLAPAGALLGQPLPDTSEAARLMTPDGVPAATWIHLYAASAAIFIGLPRMAMALSAALRRRAREARLVLDVHAPYYQRLLEAARSRQVQRIEESIGADVRDECGKFADAIADYVCESLYDRRIVPLLERFRSDGGTIAELETAIGEECEVFRPDFDRFLPVAQQNFERSLSRSIERTIGTRLHVLSVPAGQIATGVGAAAGESSGNVAQSVGHRLTDAIGGSISAAVALTAATVSGGIGHSLGTAILVGLLGTTGPIAFAIGAGAGLAIAGVGWWLGREQLTGALKHAYLPGLVARATLVGFGSVIAQGRDQCRAAVTDVVSRELEALTPQVAAQIWQSVKPLLAEQHRRGESLGALQAHD
jgi:hypothetical protein